VPASVKPVGATIGEDDSFTVGAILPSSVLDGSDTTEEEVCAPLTSRHFRWSCVLTNNTSDFPSTVSAMIDIGAHGVFIAPDTVEALSLEKFPLHEPLSISLAVNKNPKKIMLHHYVKIRPRSTDGQWMSNTVKAIITSGLCVPLLLGIPFLESNHI